MGNRVELVLVRTGFRWAGPGKTSVPSWLLLGYANDDANFERGMSDFKRLVTSIKLGTADMEPRDDGAGFASGSACGTPTPSPPAIAAPPATPGPTPTPWDVPSNTLPVIVPEPASEMSEPPPASP